MILLSSVLMIIGGYLEYTVITGLYYGNQPVAYLLLCHLFGTGAIVLALDQLKKYYRSYNASIVLVFFCLIFFIPLFGILAACFIARWLSVSQDNYAKHPIEWAELKHQIMPLRHKFGIGGLRHTLQSTDLPLSSRITAFKTLSSLPPDKVNNLVKSVLPDNHDELRLLALHLLNKQEKKFISQIDKVLALLKKAKNPHQEALLNKMLAHQYWELVTRNLVEPNIINFMLKQSLHYAELAEKYFTHDPALSYLIARIYHREKHFDQALRYFEKSLDEGYSVNRVVSYITEIYFYRRDYHSIKKYIVAQAKNQATLVNKAMIEFWRKKYV